ncbi:MAG TPA: type II toxin-antitoxin system RelE/ParE family toxin [Flavipsychrobacter sp.]|nr:type II toxin-antitoxin system RelE/ParE family toxin [Flavipsychrobacter sp.]
MKILVIFHPLAEEEFRNSFRYYEQQLPGLGLRFEKEVEYNLERISEKPESFGFDFGTYRKVALDNFPFVIVYRFDQVKHMIYIASIHHTKRNPSLKYR